MSTLSLLFLCQLAAAADDSATEPVAIEAEAGISHYINDDDLTVVGPWANYKQSLVGPMSASVGWTADVITAASVDVVSSATGAFRETRNQVNGQLLADINDTRASAVYVYSTERDTHSHTAGATGEVDLFQKNATLGATYALTALKMGAADEPTEFWDPRTVNDLSLNFTQVLGKQTIAGLGYSLSLWSGDLASPYLQVPVFPSDENNWNRESAQWVDERHPDRRGRHSANLHLRQALSERVYMHGKWRGYLDTWSMRAHSTEVGGHFDLGKGLLLDATDRLHWQSRVSFQRGVHTVNREYISSDRRLGEMITNIASLAIRPRFGENVQLVARAEFHWTHYVNQQALLDDGVQELPDVLGLVSQIGVRYTR